MRTPPSSLRWVTVCVASEGILGHPQRDYYRELGMHAATKNTQRVHLDSVVRSRFTLRISTTTKDVKLLGRRSKTTTRPMNTL